MSSETSASEGVEQRLHPLSWLFTLIGQLKQFALPLLVLLFTGKHSNTDLWGLVGVGALVLYSIAQYFSYRYRLDGDGVVIRSGLLQRSLRHIPFARIQNVSLHQSMLHRLFGVAEVRLESAGAAKPEGQMRVLRLDAAQALERRIRGRSAAVAVAAGQAAPAEQLLLALPLREVLLLGLVDNRGLLVVGGLFALLAQAGDNLIGRIFSTLGRWLSGQASAWHLSLLAAIAAAAVLLLLALAALRLLSMAIALLQFHGFRLSESEGRLSVQRGLLSRLRGSVPRHRIQAWSLGEGLLHRLVGRRSLRVDTAVTEAANQAGSLRDLVPLARPETMDALIAHLLAGDGGAAAASWPIRDWQPLHPRAWRRKFTPAALLLALATIALALWRGPWAFALLSGLPLLYWRAQVWARYSAYAVGNGLVAFRSGWLGRRWRFAESRKLQALELLQSPFDRRHGMASLRFDTAGAGAMEPALAIPYLPEAEARRLYGVLSQALAGPDPGALTRSRTAASAAPAP
jgi:putative membrane protein